MIMFTPEPFNLKNVNGIFGNYTSVELSPIKQSEL